MTNIYLKKLISCFKARNQPFYSKVIFRRIRLRVYGEILRKEAISFKLVCWTMSGTSLAALGSVL